MTATSVLVSWNLATGNAKIDRYVIMRDGAEVATVAGGTASYRDRKLRPGVRYHYRVVAERGSRRSDPSAETVAATIAPRPVHIAATATSTTSASVRWSPPPNAPAPDHYVIRRNGVSVATVVGRVTSYKDSGRIPGATLKYRIVAVWSGRRSALSNAATVTTPTPPVPSARLRGSWEVNFRATNSGGGSISTGMTWINSWQFNPQCAAGPCTVVVSGVIAPPGFIDHDFTATLTRNGAVYTGTTSAHITHCGLEPNVVEVSNQITLQITVAAARMGGASWNASKWTGTMTMSAPYTRAGIYYCPAQSVESSLAAG